jgi:hypothetical protein
VNPRQYAANFLYLNALVALKKSMEIRTTLFSETNLNSLLTECPAAITFSPPGILDTERLLGAYLENDALFRPITKSKQINRWRCYAKRPGKQQFELKELLGKREVLKKAEELLVQLVHTAADAEICALVPDVYWTAQHEDKIRSALFDAILYSSAGRVVALECEQQPQAMRAEPASGPNVLHNEDDATDRERLIRVRQQMLEKVGSYSSEELAAAAESMTSNPSQFAADQRRKGELFGVRFGREWRYPKFQFDAKRHTLPEMKPVLQALSPDEQGWDRLQWFLEPHETLQGRSPLEVWKSNRQKVIEAANTERCDGRD